MSKSTVDILLRGEKSVQVVRWYPERNYPRKDEREVVS